MKIAIIAYGTRGDVQPSIALGKALQARGHRVRLLASPNFQAWIEQHDLEAAPAAVDVQEVMASEGGHDWIEHGNNPVRQLRVMRRLIEQHGRRMAVDAWEASQGADALISQFTSIVYAGGIAQARGIPHLCMLLQPALLATRDGRAALMAPVPDRKSVLNEWSARLVIEPWAWSLYGDITNRFRRETLGLPPHTTRSFVAEFRQTPILLGYSRHLAPPPDDWPPHIHTTGYWFLDEGRDWQPPAALEEFLAAGEPPVCIGFGSMTGRDPGRISRLLIDAVQRSGRRAVLLSGWAGLGVAELPGSVLCLEDVPHDWLFPRMAAVVHHGGAGTTAAGLRAGVPNVVVPHMSDQPFWGRRVAALGVGPRPIPRPALTAEALAAAIRQATGDEALRARAAEIGRLIRSEAGLAAAADLAEHYLRPA